MKKRIMILLAVMMVTVFSLPAFAAAPISLFVNGEQITADVPPRIVQGRVILPARAILEPLGAQFFLGQQKPHGDSVQRRKKGHTQD